MDRLALGVEYDGSEFHGWQRQSHATSVQQSLEQAIAFVADEQIQLVAAGRTDTGVHATAQVVSFSTQAKRPLRAWQAGVNSRLPPAIRVVWARCVPAQFHARFDAQARRYIYLFGEAEPSALAPAQSWDGPVLAVELMHDAAQLLLGEQNFSAVRAAGCGSPTAMRRVLRVSVQRFGEVVAMDIEANAFLLHMVRNIASALRQIGTAERDCDWLAQLLRNCDRKPLGVTAPAHALYLVGVRYDPALGLPGMRLPPAFRMLGQADRLC